MAPHSSNPEAAWPFSPGGNGDGLWPQRCEILWQILQAVDDVAILATDGNGKVTAWNRGAENLFGYAEASIIGRSGDELYPPEDRAGDVPAQEREHAGQKGGIERDRWFLRADRTPLWVRSHLVPIRDAAGVLLGFSNTCRGLAETPSPQEKSQRPEQQDKFVSDGIAEVRTEQAVRDTVLQELAETLPHIVWSARADGTIEYVNRRWYDYTGLEVAESCLVAATPDAERLAVEWRDAVRAGRSFESEYRIRRGAEGMERWHLGRAVPVRNAAGEIERWVGTSTDIHDRKLLESTNADLLRAAIEARQVAEDASRMKDEFLSTISHELRTPLNAIVGWATLLQEPDLEASARREGIEAIQRNAEAQARLIEDVLDITRITTGRLQVHAEPVDLRAAVLKVVETVRAAAEASDIELVVELPLQLPRVLGDVDRLQQVFWNLLSNAIKFTPAGGHIWLTAGAGEGRVVVSVRDDGQGLEPSFLPRVFERFLQADARTTRRQGGLGLGLAIVRHLVELHSGRVSAHSAGPGQGSTFLVDLPALAARSTPRPAATPPTSGAVEFEGKRVLVLDDDADTRRVIEAVLARAGAEVTVVGSVADAVGVLMVDHDFDAVLSDIGMPEEDGYVFAKRMRAMEQARDLVRLPLAAVTAYTREQDRTHARSVGFDAFVSKPIRPTELVEIVSVMAHSRPRP